MTIDQLIKKYKLTKGIHADYYEHFQSKKIVLTHKACEKIANKEMEIASDLLNNSKEEES